jgi:hypothetical protein
MANNDVCKRWSVRIGVVLGVIALISPGMAVLKDQWQIRADLDVMKDDLDSLNNRVKDLSPQVELMKKDLNVLTEQVSNIGPQVADIHQKMIKEGWEGYSAWRWQLDMNRIYCRRLGLGRDEYPEPPAFLKERPGYNGP